MIRLFFIDSDFTAISVTLPAIPQNPARTQIKANNNQGDCDNNNIWLIFQDKKTLPAPRNPMIVAMQAEQTAVANRPPKIAEKIPTPPCPIDPARLVFERNK